MSLLNVDSGFPGLEIKKEAKHPITGSNNLEALLEQQRPCRWEFGPFTLKLMTEGGGNLASTGHVIAEASFPATKPSSPSIEGHVRPLKPLSIH